MFTAWDRDPKEPNESDQGRAQVAAHESASRPLPDGASRLSRRWVPR